MEKRINDNIMYISNNVGGKDFLLYKEEPINLTIYYLIFIYYSYYIYYFFRFNSIIHKIQIKNLYYILNIDNVNINE